jgi:hypothetical protein
MWVEKEERGGRERGKGCNNGGERLGGLRIIRERE